MGTIVGAGGNQNGEDEGYLFSFSFLLGSQDIPESDPTIKALKIGESPLWASMCFMATHSHRGAMVAEL